MEINESRLRKSFEEYSRIGATEDGGLHRMALSNADKRARDKFVTDLEDASLLVRVDEIGNIFGRREGRNPDMNSVLLGSHLDSQPNGGRFDGQLGVLVALETVRSFEDQAIKTKRPVEVVNWTNEEGARFKLAPSGVGVFTGKYSQKEVFNNRDRNGILFQEALKKIGYKGDEEHNANNIESYLELHIEQGPNLADNNTSVGIVEGVVGLTWLEASITGKANHAGTTPMYDRSDALVAAIDAIHSTARCPQSLSNDIVLTTGNIRVQPGSTNIIPEEVEFTYDIRSYCDRTMDEAIRRVESEIETAASREGCEYEISEIFSTSSTEFSEVVKSSISSSVQKEGVTSKNIVSQAGHDAMYMSDVAETGMIFVPSEDGISHSEKEFTKWDDVLAGANTFASSAKQLATK